VEDDIESRLTATAEALREFEFAGTRRERLRQGIVDHERHLASLREELAGEESDVAKLEGFSLTRLLVTLRGERQDALARERAEADLVRYRLAEIEARLMAIVGEEAANQTRLDLLTDAPAAYAAALDEKERLLTARKDPRSARLLETADERGRCRAELKEITEAQRAATSAAEALAEVDSKLGSAGSWSTYDTFFGGGLIGSAIKHSRLDDAAEAAARADRCLALLRTELADVGAADMAAPQLGITELTRFVDIVFDNIFTDLSVRSRIQDAQWSVDRCRRLVAQIRSNLDRRAEVVRARLAELERQRRELLTG
jgi:hypothetical protein